MHPLAIDDILIFHNGPHIVPTGPLKHRNLDPNTYCGTMCFVALHVFVDTIPVVDTDLQWKLSLHQLPTTHVFAVHHILSFEQSTKT